MKIQDVPFCTVNWNAIKPTTHPGVAGEAYWRTFEMGNIRVRMVEYSPGYLADHWCKRGHACRQRNILLAVPAIGCL